MKNLVLLDTSSQPFWKMPESFKTKIQEALGPEWAIITISGFGGDVSGLKLADAIIGFPFPLPLIRENKNLKWVHFLTAQVPVSWQKAPVEVTVTNSSVSTSAVAEHGLYLALKGIRRESFLANHHEWSLSNYGIARSTQALKVGIVGLGKIGSKLCDFTKPLFKEVHVLTHRTEALEGVTVYGHADQSKFFGEIDVLFLCTNLNPQSEKTFKSGQFFGLLKKDIVIVNIARGELLNEAELHDFLAENTESLYLTDVTTPEPYPIKGILNDLENVFISPHVGARFHGIWKELEGEVLLKVKTPENL